MIAKANFSMEHIQELRRATKCDPGLLERTLYAFGLLEALSRVGLSFTFKGGTSLMLLLEHPMRLSTAMSSAELSAGKSRSAVLRKYSC